MVFISWRGLCSDIRISGLKGKNATLKLHLKIGFRSHIWPESVQRCLQYVLSEKKWQHFYTRNCWESSEIKYSVRTEIQNLVESINFPNIHEREKLSWLIGVSRESFCVGDFLIKIVNQDLCKRNFLENLKSHEVLIHVIADWTMIFLGSKASAGIWIVLVSVTHIQMTLTTVTSLTLFPWFL